MFFPVFSLIGGTVFFLIAPAYLLRIVFLPCRSPLKTFRSLCRPERLLRFLQGFSLREVSLR